MNKEGEKIKYIVIKIYYKTINKIKGWKIISKIVK